MYPIEEFERIKIKVLYPKKLFFVKKNYSEKNWNFKLYINKCWLGKFAQSYS